MVSPPIISQDEEDLSAVAFKILNNNISGTPVISSDRLIGVISSLDLLKAIAKELQVVEPLQVKVKAKIEDSTKLSMERMINYSISRLNRFTEVLNISTSIKEYSDKVEGGRTKFDIHVKVVTPRGTLVAEGIAWDPLGALREALKKIERRLIKETGRKRTKVLKTKRYKDEGFREG
jgi:CBS domain./Sigma 54 modulation protein / S30EA ribosomal protein.